MSSWSIPGLADFSLNRKIISGDYAALKQSVSESNTAVEHMTTIVPTPANAQDEATIIKIDIAGD